MISINVLCRGTVVYCKMQTQRCIELLANQCVCLCACTDWTHKCYLLNITVITSCISTKPVCLIFFSHCSEAVDIEPDLWVTNLWKKSGIYPLTCARVPVNRICWWWLYVTVSDPPVIRRISKIHTWHVWSCKVTHSHAHNREHRCVALPVECQSEKWVQE